MKSLIATILALLICTSILSQSESELKQALEGKRVEILIEMPATSEGINIYADKATPFKFSDYSQKIKNFGIALFPGDVVMITKIKKKSKHIEFQIAGGGYGTFGDEGTHVSADNVPKSSREKELEKILKDDEDKKLTNRKKLQNELDDLRRDRQLREKDNRRQAALESEIKRSRIQDKRLQGGSRFNIRYDYKVGNGELTVDNITSVLGEYINFNPGQPSAFIQDGSRDDMSSASLTKGMSIDESMRILGMPNSLNTTNECGLEITRCKFDQDDKSVEAVFVEKVLVKYSLISK